MQRRERKTVGLRRACGECSVSSAPCISPFQVYPCGFMQRPSPGMEGGCGMCQTTGAEASLWGRARAPVSALGLLASGRSTQGPLSCGREGTFEYVMTVGAFSTHSTQPTVSTYVSTPCRACGGFFVGTGDEQDVGSPLRGLRPLRRAGNTGPTVTATQRPGLGPRARRGFWPLGQSHSI